MVTALVPVEFSVHDEATANWVVRIVMQARAYADRVKQWADAELRRAQREEERILYLYGGQLQDWVTSEIAKAKGKRRSLNLPAGRVGYRKVPSRFVIEDACAVMAWARAGCPDAIKTVERLESSIVMTHIQLTGEVPPAGVRQEPEYDKFFIR